MLSAAVLLEVIGHGGPVAAHAPGDPAMLSTDAPAVSGSEVVRTAAASAQEPAAAAAAPEMFEHGPVPSAERGGSRSGSVVATVRLRADLTRAQEFLLNLPDLPTERLKVEALRKRSERNYSFRGKGQDSVAELVVTEQGATGTISVGGASFGLQSLGNSWSDLVRLDREPKHYPNKPEAPKELGKAKPGPADADSGAKVNVLVVYTPAAAAWNGDVKALIQLAEDKTNTALANSQVPSMIDIVHSAQVTYTEAADMRDDLHRLQNTSDGFMDEVHALRDMYKADLVALLVDPGNYGGIAWINSSAAYGFSVTATNGVYYNVFQHELGHNWWMQHNPEEDGASRRLLMRTAIATSRAAGAPLCLTTWVVRPGSTSIPAPICSIAVYQLGQVPSATMPG
jgi:hypothetical protein